MGPEGQEAVKECVVRATESCEAIAASDVPPSLVQAAEDTITVILSRLLMTVGSVASEHVSK